MQKINNSLIIFLLMLSSCQNIDIMKQGKADTQLDWAEGLITIETAKEELADKVLLLKDYLKSKNADAVILGKERNIKWLTGGYFNSQIVLNKESGSVMLIVDKEGKLYLLSNNIEVRRSLEDGLEAMEFKPLVFDWYLPGRMPSVLDEVFGGLGKLLSDHPIADIKLLADDFKELRYSLHPHELSRYRALAMEVTKAVEEVCYALEQGMSEKQLEAMTAMALWKRGILPTVLLMGADERIADYRHALPSDARFKEMAMINVVAEKWNMPVAITRFVHFGPMDSKLEEKFKAVARVNALYHHNTRPGQNVRGIFGAMQGWYEQVGFRWEWEKHHQGGAIGYDDREYVIRPDLHAIVRENQAFAWNPTITGSKMEETILATSSGPEVLTKGYGKWPMFDVEIEGKNYPQPWVLIR
jgi:Xaa-Pro aminopeptidase